MSAVRSKNTRLEEKLIEILESEGLTNYNRYAKDLPGTPDVVFRAERVAVFLDSCFWHGCPRHLRRPSSNTDYWQVKIEKNIRRDRRQRAALRRAGWSALRIWEHDLGRPQAIVKKIQRVLSAKRAHHAQR